VCRRTARSSRRSDATPAGGDTPGATGSGETRAGGQTPGATGSGTGTGGETLGAGGLAAAENWHRQQGEWRQRRAKQVSFAEEIATCIEIEKEEEGVQGTTEPHLPSSKSLSTFLAVMMDAGLEVDPILPGVRSWCHEVIESMSVGYGSALLGQQELPDNSFLGVCVSCPPFGTDALAATLPILLAQVLPYLGRVRVHVLLPEGNDSILMWALAALEFPIRLQLLRIYVAEGGSHYHDAVWRNTVGREAIRDCATCARNLVDTGGIGDRRSIRIWIH